MPLPDGTRYRVKITKSGDKVRLAFSKGTDKVIEAKNLDTKAVHTPEEFKADRKREGKRGRA